MLRLSRGIQGAPRSYSTAPVSRPARAPSGHVFVVERSRGAVWYAKYRLRDGRQVQRRIGPAWTGRGRTPDGYFSRRTAEVWLWSVLEQAASGMLPDPAPAQPTFADAVAEFLRYAEADRTLKPSTLRGYRSIVRAYLLPAFGELRLEEVTTAGIEQWRSQLAGARGGQLSNATKNRIVVLMHGIFKRACKVYGLPTNPVAGVERHPARSAGDIDVFSPEEVWALVSAAACEQDAAIYLTAAFTGLRRGELLALRWRDVDFAASVIRVRASYAAGALTTPKSGKVRSVPLAPDVAEALAKLADRRWFTSVDHLVFVGETGSHLDGSALRRRYIDALRRAGLRPLRFHDLRHTFGTRMIAKADIRRVQEWMGHADVQTTMRYLHYAPRDEDARLVAEAFRGDQVGNEQASTLP
jgi:integrase